MLSLDALYATTGATSECCLRRVGVDLVFELKVKIESKAFILDSFCCYPSADVSKCPHCCTLHLTHPAAQTFQPPEQFEWSDTSPAFVAAMRAMTTTELLRCLAELKVAAADKLREQLEEASELQSAWRRALKDAAIQGRTNEGRRTFQTLLTAVAYDGDGPSKVTAKRKSEIFGVHPEHLVAARRRVTALRPELPPLQAIDEKAYYFHPRTKRSDATPPEMLELMGTFWHTDGISRASGNSKDIWQESKSPSAKGHPRRQLIVEGQGEAVYEKFLV